MKSQFRFIKNHTFTKDVFVLQSAGMIAKAIAMVASLLFAAILGPEQYGFYGLVFALAGFINIFQEFGIGQGAVNLLASAHSRDDREEAKRILKFFAIMSAVGLGFGIVGFVISPYLGERFYDSRYLGTLASIVVATTALTFFLPLVSLTFQVGREIKKLAIIETLNKLLGSLIPLGLVLVGYGVLGIVSGQLLGMLLMSVVTLVVYLRFTKKSSFFPKLREIFRTPVTLEKLKHFFRFSFEIAITKNLIKLNTTIPILFVGLFLPTNSALGFYKIALAYVSLPLILIGPISRLLNVQFPLTSVAGSDKLFKRFFQVTIISSLFMSVITGLLVLLAKPAVLVFFPDYQPSIRLIYGLVLFPIFSSLGVGLGPLFRTLDRMKGAIFIQVVNFLMLLPVSFVLIKNHAIVGLVLTTLIFTLVPNLLSFIYLVSVRKRNV